MDFDAMYKAEKGRMRAAMAAAAIMAPTTAVPFTRPLLLPLGYGISYCNEFLIAAEAIILQANINAMPASAW